MTVPYFPFSAIVGQEKLKEALVLNAINPAIGGVLIFGEKGTAKSTAVRGLKNILELNSIQSLQNYHINESKHKYQIL